MPRDSSGSYSLPAGTIVASGDDLLPSQHNPAFLDVAQSLGNSLSRDGTGGMRAPLDHGNFKATNMAQGTLPTDGATVAQASAAGVPIGSVIDFAGITAPTGWLLCYGQTVSRTVYAALYAAIGTTFGAGDGTTTFAIPDLRGIVVAGKGDMGGATSARLSTQTSTILGAAFGEQAHALTLPEIPAHDHGAVTGSAGAHSHVSPGLSSPSGGNIGAVAGTGSLGAGFQTTAVGDHSHSIASQGGGGAHNNVQPTMILNKIIRSGS